VGTLLVRLRRSWILLFVLCVVLMGLGVATGVQLVIGLGVGLLLGCYARDLGTCLKMAAAWPAINEIIDWERLEQLLSQHCADRQVRN
jgi:hypothetical protein